MNHNAMKILVLVAASIAGSVFANDYTLEGSVISVGSFDDWGNFDKVAVVAIMGPDADNNGVPDYAEDNDQNNVPDLGDCGFGMIVLDDWSSAATATTAGQASFSLANSALLAGKSVHIDYTAVDGMCIATDVYYTLQQ